MWSETFDAVAKVRRWMADRRALVIGIAGQDGSLLAELLLSEGYGVFGVVRQPVSTRFENLEAIRAELELSQADVLDELSLVDVLTSVVRTRSTTSLPRRSCHVVASTGADRGVRRGGLYGAPRGHPACRP